MRHAEADAKESRQDDRMRALTQRGIKGALHVGAWFAEQNMRWDLIVSSSALRAEQTANLVVEGSKLESTRILSEDVLYDATVRQLLDYVNNIEDAYHDVMIVAHNPAVTYLAEYLTKADIGDMSPGAVVIVRFPFQSWKHVSENTGVMERHLTPEEVARF